MSNSTAEFQKKTGKICEAPGDEEIDLVGYFLVLWKRKTLVLLGTALPAVCAATALLPRNHTAAYVYDVSSWGLGEKNKIDLRMRKKWEKHGIGKC